MPETYGNDPDGQNPRALEAYRRILAGRNPYGSAGMDLTEIVGQLNNGMLRFEDLPKWVQSAVENRLDPEGSSRQWMLRDGGILQLPDGRWVIQIGNESAAVGEGDLSVQDWSRVEYHPDYGLITELDNRRSVTSDASRNGRLLTLAAMAAMGGYAAMNPGTASLGLGASEVGTAAAAGAPTTGAAATGAAATGAAGIGATGAGINPALLQPVTTGIVSSAAPVLTAAPTITSAAGTGLLGGLGAWYNGLSPAGRMLVNSAISQGTGALISSNAQREAQREADRREEEQRQDRVRRGSVSAFAPGAFRPRTPNTGIIGSKLPPGKG